jgi:hypothetical protein
VCHHIVTGHSPSDATAIVCGRGSPASFKTEGKGVFWSPTLRSASLSALSGRPSFVKGNIDITSLRSWLNDSTATAGDYMLVGFIELRAIEVRFAQRHGRLCLTRQHGAKDSLVAAGQPYVRDGIRQGCVVQLEGWVNWWCGTPLVSQGTSLIR